MADFTRDVYCLFGLPFDAVDMPGAVRVVQEAAAHSTPCLVSTPNVNFLIGSREDSRFRDSVVNSDLCVADGMPLVWLARLLGVPIRQRVAGSCLYEQLSRDTQRLSVYFFGGGPGVAEAASRKLNGQSAGLVCVGYESPGFGSIEDMSSSETIEKINRSGADFLIVSLGAKKGQAWIEHNRHRLTVPVVSHLGAVINFAAGAIARAPAYVRNAGLEWLWRIKEEPQLWRRYLRDGLGLLALLLTRALPYAWHERRRAARPSHLDAPGLDTTEEGPYQVIQLRGAWTRKNLDPLRACFSRIAQLDKHVKVDLGLVTHIDSAFIGLLMLLHGDQARRGRQFVMSSASQPVRRVLRLCCAEYLCSAPAESPATATIKPVLLADGPDARLIG